MDELSKLKAQRKNLRCAFTITNNKVESEFAKKDIDVKNLALLQVQLSDKFQRLDTCQTSINECLLQQEGGEKTFDTDFTESESYRDLYLESNAKINQVLEDTKLEVEVERHRQFKLPRMELKKFDGDPKEYLSFWSQFQKVHEDRTISDEDKMQYLVAAMEPKSKAERLIKSFPATAANYPNAVAQLRERFGREDLLVQIYVRDLLSMVMKNAVSGRVKTDLASLYDELEGKLRALETLKRTQEKFSDFLTPLVESCLPEEVLMAWERSRNHQVTEDNTSRSLQNLMTFLRQEVQGEEMVELSRTGFAANPPRKRDPNHSERHTVQNDQQATASALVNFSNPGKKTPCVWCEKTNHKSLKCFAAKKMSIEEKIKILSCKNACFTCLNTKVNHRSKNCSLKSQLKCFVCSGSHYEIMCNNKPLEKPTVNSAPNSEVSLFSSGTKNKSEKRVYLQTICLTIKAQEQTQKVRGLLDTGCSRSYVSSILINEIGGKPLRTETLIHNLFGGSKTEPKLHPVYSVQIGDLLGRKFYSVEVIAQDILCGYIPRLSDPELLRDLESRNIELSDSFSEEEEIKIILGADVIARILSGQVIDLNNGITAIKTELGYTILGQKDDTLHCNNNVVTTFNLHARSVSVNDLWELEKIGIDNPVERDRKTSVTSDYLEDFQQNLTILPDGRYNIKLPFNRDLRDLPDNKNLALKRHESMIIKAKGNNYLKDYQEVFQNWEKLNIIERVPENELDNDCHYLPHRPVIKLSSETTKIRPVFDASSREKGKCCLNDYLYTGVNLIELIPDIIDRFRLYPIGLSADIERAFLELSILREHRDYLRFFYPSDKKEVYRHCRLVFGLNASPFILSASMHHVLENSDADNKEIAQKLKSSFYVDNCLCGVNNANEQDNFIEKSKSILSKACFNLRGWQSNVAGKLVSQNTGDATVLGMLWNLDNDTLRCNINLEAVTIETQITKRIILSKVQKIFDINGVLTPATLLPKLLLQDTWKLKLSWDLELPKDIVQKFLKWLNETHLLRDVTLPRYIEFNDTSELHVFVDASGVSYATCVFVRTVVNEEVKVTFIRAKSRLAPLKKLSIPRLELLACCIGARLANSIRHALNLPEIKVTYWSDSSVALWWIKKCGNWSVFVMNRVKEIREISNAENWRFIPGTMNPSDLLSRGCTPKQMLESKWWEGPHWLRKCEESWPVSEITCKPEEVGLETKKSIVCVNIVEELDPWYSGRFSNYHSIIRMVGWLLRFKMNAQTSVKFRKSGELSSEEVVEAEKVLIRSVQGKVFPSLSSIKLVNAFKDGEGIIRIKTKLTERHDDPSFIAPILLPGKSMLTERIIEYYHKINCHAGVQILMSILRERFWILKARKTIKSVIKNCVRCSRFSSKSPACGPVGLPEDRVKDATIFDIVGIDLAGPLFVRDGKKAWIVLFTCAIYRAVHLEVTSSLSTENFMLALRRFIARRTRPTVIYSDNGTNFRGADNEFKELDWAKITHDTEIQPIKWKFNPPAASWWGGFWERLVRVLKELLRRTLGNAILTYEELTTVLCDCEAIINSRPLTYIAEDSTDLIPLTPNLFLTGKPIYDPIELDLSEFAKFQRRIKYRHKLLQDLRSRFRKEYLGLLIQTKESGRPLRKLELGEVVLIGDDSKKRIKWPLAVIIELIPGRDGSVRTVRLKTSHGTILRPVQRVYPLEVRGDFGAFGTKKPIIQKQTGIQKENVTRTRSGRQVKIPDRLCLFNYENEVFWSDGNPSKRGEDVGNEKCSL